MRVSKINTIVFFAFFAFLQTNAQIKIGERALGAVQNGIASFTFTDADAAAIAKEAVRKMDSANVVADSKNGYTIRLNKLFGKHAQENGLVLNYKVYLTKEVNAFATADGSVRVFSGLMDIMDDNQLLAVIGHEIGHVANRDSRDAIKAAYRKAALIGAVSSQSEKIANLTDSQYGQIGNAILDSHYSRKQESEADLYAYEFMKRNKYNVNAVESAFAILAKMNGGAEADFLSKMMSSHPDPQERAQKAKERAQADGLYKAYVQLPINNKPPKAPVKKAPTKKKK